MRRVYQCEGIVDVSNGRRRHCHMVEIGQILAEYKASMGPHFTVCFSAVHGAMSEGSEWRQVRNWTMSIVHRVNPFGINAGSDWIVQEVSHGRMMFHFEAAACARPPYTSQH